MLHDRVVRYLEDNGIRLRGERVIAGVSGGVDSVVLLDVLQHIGAKPTAVHVNYGLRGRDSDADEMVVRRLCDRLSVELEVTRADPTELWPERSGSLQELAREIRYRQFRLCAEGRSAGWVATAHNKEDQAETVLMNLIRGAGPGGMAGIPACRPLGEKSRVRVVRPLLDVCRSDIVEYAASRGLEWREDVSNADPRFRRSTIRHRVLRVLIEEFGEQAVDGIVRSAHLTAAAAQSGRAPALADLLSVSEGVAELPIAVLEGMPIYLQGSLVLQTLHRFFPSVPRSKAVVDSILGLAGSQTGRAWDHPAMRVTRERDHLVFSPGSPAASPDVDRPVPIAAGQSVRIDGGILRAEYLSSVPADLDPGTPLIAFADSGRFVGSLTVDQWRPGDAIRLLGSGDTRKVSDILTDLKVPHLERRKVRVVRSGADVVWIVGLRLSADYAVTEDTRTVLMLSAVPKGPSLYFRS